MIIGTMSSMAMGVADFPIQTLKLLKIHPDADSGDSSGRLTGRYHRACFVCTDCSAPFPNGEFYVMDNAPLCSIHYHQRAGTNCRRCGDGIEGRYAETDRGQMFHERCFRCVRCDEMLGEEYWDLDGRPMCKLHAFEKTRAEAMRGGGAMGGARREPRKRTTRLGMMGMGMGMAMNSGGGMGGYGTRAGREWRE